jgi:hypothetical protein
MHHQQTGYRNHRQRRESQQRVSPPQSCSFVHFWAGKWQDSSHHGSRERVGRKRRSCVKSECIYDVGLDGNLHDVRLESSGEERGDEQKSKHCPVQETQCQ